MRQKAIPAMCSIIFFVWRIYHFNKKYIVLIQTSITLIQHFCAYLSCHTYSKCSATWKKWSTYLSTPRPRRRPEKVSGSTWGACAPGGCGGACRRWWARAEGLPPGSRDTASASRPRGRPTWPTGRADSATPRSEAPPAVTPKPALHSNYTFVIF